MHVPEAEEGRRPEIVVVADRAALAVEGARRVAEAVRAGSGEFRLALAGGSTPRDLYRRLAGQNLPWTRVQLFWGDERCVPPDDPESNYRMAREALLQAIPIPPANVHRIAGERPPAEAAQAYAQELAGCGDGLDLAIQGLGAEGHTASLFPDSPALRSERTVEAVFVAKLGAWRITLTPRLLAAAATVMFVVAGEDKAEAVRSVLTGAHDPRRLPAQALRGARCVWLLDRAAAAGLPVGWREAGQGGAAWP